MGSPALQTDSLPAELLGKVHKFNSNEYGIQKEIQGLLMCGVTKFRPTTVSANRFVSKIAEY